MTPAQIQEFEQLEIINDRHDTSRVVAYNKTKTNKYHVYAKHYRLSPQVKGFMLAQGMNAAAFTHVEGNDFQHHLTQEIVGTLKNAGNNLDHFLNELATCAGLAQSYNIAKDFTRSMLAIDFCYSRLRYEEAIVLGLCDTIVGAIDFARHPIKHITDMGRGLKQLVYGAGKGAWDLAKYATAVEHGFTKEAQEIKEYYFGVWKELKKTTKQTLVKTTGPQAVRAATNIISDQVLTRKAISGLGEIVIKLAKALKTHPSMPAYKMLEGLAKEDKFIAQAAFAEGFYCADEAVQIGEEVNGVTTLMHGHLHQIYHPDELCKTLTAELAYIKKAPELIGSAAKRLPGTARVLKLINASKQTPKMMSITQIAKEVLDPKLKEARLLKEAIAKSKSKFTRLKGLSKTSDKIYNIIDQTKVKSLALLKATERAIKACPPCGHCENIVERLIETEKEKIRTVGGKKKLVKMRIKHLLLPRIKSSGAQYQKFKLCDLHYDCKLQLENLNGEIKFLNKTTRQGCYRVDVDAFGRKETFVKTFFPTDWPPEKVLEKVDEALKNLIHEGGFGRKLATGYTKDNIKIRFMLDIQADFIEVISACPCENWIMGL